jgi:transcriptional regulator with XRE-family HTH domain
MALAQRESFRRQLGVRLRELRKRAGIASQERLAHLAGVDRTYIGRLERGRTGVTVESLVTILGVIDISLAEFFRVFSQSLHLRTPRRRD